MNLVLIGLYCGIFFGLLIIAGLILYKTRVTWRSWLRRDNCLMFERTKGKKMPTAVRKDMHKSFAVRMLLENKGVIEWFITLKDARDLFWKWNGRAYAIDPKMGINNSSLGMLEYTYYEKCSLPLNFFNISNNIWPFKPCARHHIEPKPCEKHKQFTLKCEACAIHENFQREREQCPECFRSTNEQGILKNIGANLNPETMYNTLGGSIIRTAFALTEELAKYIKASVVISALTLLAVCILIGVIYMKVGAIIPKGG